MLYFAEDEVGVGGVVAHAFQFFRILPLIQTSHHCQPTAIDDLFVEVLVREGLNVLSAFHTET